MSFLYQQTIYATIKKMFPLLHWRQLIRHFYQPWEGIKWSYAYNLLQMYNKCIKTAIALLLLENGTMHSDLEDPFINIKQCRGNRNYALYEHLNTISYVQGITLLLQPKRKRQTIGKKCLIYNCKDFWTTCLQRRIFSLNTKSIISNASVQKECDSDFVRSQWKYANIIF